MRFKLGPDPKGNNEFCFPETLKHRGCFIIPPDLKMIIKKQLPKKI